MKKIALIIAAIFTMVQMNAAHSDAATATEAPVVAATADEDNDVTYDHPFKSDDDTKHWSIMSSGVYIGMGVSHSWDMINNSFEAGLLNAVAVKYNSLHGQNISLGVGIHHRSYSMKRPNMLERDNNNVVIAGVYPSINVDEIKNRTSNLNMWSMQFPLMFTQRIVKKLDITIAGILNWNYNAQVDNHYEINKIENNTRYKGLKQQTVNFDFMGSLNWNEFGVYCRYSPGKFFKEGYGPEIKNTWTLGLVFGL